MKVDTVTVNFVLKKFSQLDDSSLEFVLMHGQRELAERRQRQWGLDTAKQELVSGDSEASPISATSSFGQ